MFVTVSVTVSAPVIDCMNRYNRLSLQTILSDVMWSAASMRAAGEGLGDRGHSLAERGTPFPVFWLLGMAL